MGITTTIDFTTGFEVEQTPAQVFNAINNVQSWWSQAVTGETNKLNGEFTYHYKDVHISKMKVVEFVPDQKVVWLVQENYFNFTKDKSEWTGTNIIFEITTREGKTQLTFTHQGLVPAYECYDICKNAWTTYIQNSLKELITTGKGRPNPIEEIVNEASVKAKQLKKEDYTAGLTLNTSPQKAFEGINNVAGWWSENMESTALNLNDEFTVRFGETYITSKVVELVPNTKIVWLVIDCYKHWLKNKKEWNGTKMVWDIKVTDKGTQINFTHIGLVPGLECYNGCENAWSGYINGSLQKLITTGKGKPEKK